MKKFTLEQLEKFVFSQKDDRMIDMSNTGVGDILCHYGRFLTRHRIIWTSFSGFFYKNQKVCAIVDEHKELLRNFIIRCIQFDIQNYKQAKKHWNEFFNKRPVCKYSKAVNAIA